MHQRYLQPRAIQFSPLLSSACPCRSMLQASRVLSKPRLRHSVLFRPSAVPADDRVVPDQIKFQVVSPNRDEDGSRTTPSNAEFEYDEETKTMKVPLSALQETRNERRTRLVTFSCNKCGGRTTRAVNPIAWEKGMVYCQCGQCSVWHVLAANNPLIYEEIRFEKETEPADKQDYNT